MKFYALLIIALLTGCNTSQSSVASVNVPKPTPKQRMAKSFNGTPVEFNKAIPARVVEALENAEEIEILTLDPNLEDAPVIEKFIGTFSISGNKTTKLAKGSSRTELIEAFYADVETGGGAAACFSPHHAIKASYKGEQIAIEICFECQQFYGIISNQPFGERKANANRPLANVNVSDKSGWKEENFSGSIADTEISKSLPLFNKIAKIK